MNILGPFMVAGMVVGAGVLLIIMGTLRSPIRLTDAFAALEGSVPETQETRSEIGYTLPTSYRSPTTSSVSFCCRDEASPISSLKNWCWPQRGCFYLQSGSSYRRSSETRRRLSPCSWVLSSESADISWRI